MDLVTLTAEIIAFRDARDWGQFHTTSQVAAALAVEAGELQALTLFGRTPDAEELARELADVMIYALTLAHDCGLDPAEIIREKVHLNSLRYPVELCRGSAAKR